MTPDELADTIQDYCDSPYHHGRLQGATHHGKRVNESCGDSVWIQLKVEAGYVMEAYFDGDGCCMSLASASMLLHAIEGKLLSEVKRLTATDWMRQFEGVVTPRKRRCVLLSWEALQLALNSEST